MNRWIFHCLRKYLRLTIQNLKSREQNKNQQTIHDLIQKYEKRHVVLVGAAPSAVSLENYNLEIENSDEIVVIGCNWTPYLRGRLDIFISPYIFQCALAQKRRPEIQYNLNPVLDGVHRGYGTICLKKRSFRGEVSFVLQESLRKKHPLLYTDQNVMWEMVNLAYGLRPKSIIFCGFDASSSDSVWTHFFENRPDTMAQMFQDITQLQNIEHLGKEHQSDMERHIHLLFRHLFLPSSQVDQSTLKQPVPRSIIADTGELARKRARLVDDFLECAAGMNAPIYRMGESTLFSHLPEWSPYEL